MPKIYFVDVTNRDGVQTSRLGLAKLQKTIINLMLDDMGITQSEFGFPTTMHELNYLNANLELVRRGVISRTKLSGWMRAIASDVEQSFSNCPLLENCNLSQSTSDQMSAASPKHTILTFAADHILSTLPAFGHRLHCFPDHGSHLFVYLMSHMTICQGTMGTLRRNTKIFCNI